MDIRGLGRPQHKQLDKFPARSRRPSIPGFTRHGRGAEPAEGCLDGAIKRINAEMGRKNVKKKCQEEKKKWKKGGNNRMKPLCDGRRRNKLNTESDLEQAINS